MNHSISWYAERYINRFGMKLVPIEPLRKFPQAPDWGIKVISDPKHAASFYETNPDWNMGLAIGPSGFCSLDIDCLKSFAIICENFGIDFETLRAQTPTIQGSAKGMRLMFRVPAGMDLPYAKLNWPNERDPDGSIHRGMMKDAMDAEKSGDKPRALQIREDAKQFSRYTVFEFRSATDGSQKQDVLPPSIHPETLQPYKWLVQPRADWPEPPAYLLKLWSDFSTFKSQMQEMCPWAPVADVLPVRESRPIGEGDSVIDKYVDQADLSEHLKRYGYTRKGKRWLSPHSGTGLAGVRMFPDGRSCWICHASDPLCSEDSGRPVNAFDLFCYYDHNGDTSAAVKAAADMLGLKPEPRARMQKQINGHAHKSADVPATVAPAEPPAPVFTRAQYNLAEPLPFTNAKGRPLKHIENLKEICRRAGITIRYNVISKEEEILIPGHGFSIDNGANASLAWLKSECSLFEFSADACDGMVTYLADQNQYNPVAEWVGSRPWDGVSRLQDWYDTVTAEGDDDPEKRRFKETLMKRWAISAIAAAHSPDGIAAAGVLTFQGDQYVGKTKWFKSLVPQEMGVLQDGMTLRPDDKDSVKQCVSFWLVELGELDATFRKTDIAALKAFLTRKNDVLRRAYARKESQFSRRTVFFGSVNQKEFLHDATGNRRYWTIKAEKLDHSHSIDMQQMWAEVLELWKGGEGYYLLPDEMNMLNASNEEFMAIDPIEERLTSWLNWDEAEVYWRWMTATDIMQDIGFDRPTIGDCTRCALLMRKLNKGKSKRSNGKNQLLCPNPIRLK